MLGWYAFILTYKLLVVSIQNSWRELYPVRLSSKCNLLQSPEVRLWGSLGGSGDQADTSMTDTPADKTKVNCR